MIMKHVNYLKTLLLLGVIVFITGCYPDKIDYVDEYDVAGTKYDEEAVFSSYTTFHVLDTIMHLTDDGEDDPNFTRQFDDLIIGLMRDNMIANGYTEMANPDSLNMPDLLLFVEALSSDYYQYYGGWGGYWGYYPGWGYPGYPWYPSYPWYPTYVTSYSTGTLLVEMMDSKSYDPENNSAGMVWLGAVDGLLSSNKSGTRTRLEKQINQLFIQSEYLQK
jgi:hypothetical protein